MSHFLFLFSGAKQCRPVNLWSENCTLTITSTFTCTIQGLFANPANCSMFFQCSGYNSHVCQCTCKEENMYFDVNTQQCQQWHQGLDVNCSIVKNPATIPLISMENNTDISQNVSVSRTIDYTQSNTTFQNVTSDYTISSDSNRTMWRNNSYHRLKETNTKSQNTQDITKYHSVPHKDVSKPQKRIMYFTVTDIPTFPTWCIAMLVFIGVLFLLGIILYLYH